MFASSLAQKAMEMTTALVDSVVFVARVYSLCITGVLFHNHPLGCFQCY